MKAGFLKLILPPLLLCACARSPGPDAEFCLQQARAEPEWRIEDAAKWLVHATRGGEHAIASEFAARQWLENEWAALGPPQDNEPLWVPLTPDGRIGRLNLRPYQTQGGDLDALHAAFIAGAETFDADSRRFLRAWRSFGRLLAAAPQGHLTHAEWKRLDRDWRAQGDPAIHHSPDYRDARRPAYRVLPLAQAQPLLDSLP
jgi:hypothetical protein